MNIANTIATFINIYLEANLPSYTFEVPTLYKS